MYIYIYIYMYIIYIYIYIYINVMLTHVLPRVARGGVRGLPPRGDSMAKMQILGPKSHQNDRFSSKVWVFSGSSRITSFDVLLCVLMSWSSGKLAGMILGRFGITHFFSIFLKLSVKIWIYNLAFQHVYCIDLRFVMCNLH